MPSSPDTDGCEARRRQDDLLVAPFVDHSDRAREVRPVQRDARRDSGQVDHLEDGVVGDRRLRREEAEVEGRLLREVPAAADRHVRHGLSLVVRGREGRRSRPGGARGGLRPDSGNGAGEHLVLRGPGVVLHVGFHLASSETPREAETQPGLVLHRELRLRVAEPGRPVAAARRRRLLDDQARRPPGVEARCRRDEAERDRPREVPLEARREEDVVARSVGAKRPLGEAGAAGGHSLDGRSLVVRQREERQPERAAEAEVGPEGVPGGDRRDDVGIGAVGRVDHPRAGVPGPDDPAQLQGRLPGDRCREGESQAQLLVLEDLAADDEAEQAAVGAEARPGVRDVTDLAGVERPLVGGRRGADRALHRVREAGGVVEDGSDAAGPGREGTGFGSLDLAGRVSPLVRRDEERRRGRCSRSGP